MAKKQDTKRKENRLTIQMPQMGGDALSRLEDLIASKESLLKKALGTDSLLLAEADGKLEFPWFAAGSSADEVKAYTDLVSALCRRAKAAKRINAKDKPVDNEKYAFRCFLIRLGLNGDEYKTTRKVLLRNFTGSCAFKNGRPSPKRAFRVDLDEGNFRTFKATTMEEARQTAKEIAEYMCSRKCEVQQITEEELW